ncbi:TPM domain-containing protein [Bifidobacterium moukalabense]|uniref:TPM domain-containing protein n=1 Tax=Bifidobacterium moukalabense TaxID=1333651 RepID=UPI0010F8CE08|nr:TPM domain-containing protein [Bifidobacterium moukalabense]
MAKVSGTNTQSKAVVGGWSPNGCIGVSCRYAQGEHRWIHALSILLAAVLCCCMTLCITPVGWADDAQTTDTQTGITATDNITDTENLLGSNVSEITDAIKNTKKETGVTVRLLYLSTFDTGKKKPSQWASDLLESLKPQPNTVLLAVASNDGNLVVAVSSNSDEWLKKKSTVNALSDAAQKPLMESTPDWAKSATAMMDQIVLAKKTSTSSNITMIGVGVMVGVLVLLIVIIVVFHVYRKKHPKRRRKRHGSHRKSKGGEFETYPEVEEKAEPAKAWNPEPSTEDSDIVQETSSESSEA